MAHRCVRPQDRLGAVGSGRRPARSDSGCPSPDAWRATPAPTSLPEPLAADSVPRELQANVRVDWIHTPGSDLFPVLDTGYITDDTLDPRFDPWTRRTAVAKLTWLTAF